MSKSGLKSSPAMHSRLGMPLQPVPLRKTTGDDPPSLQQAGLLKEALRYHTNRVAEFFFWKENVPSTDERVCPSQRKVSRGIFGVTRGMEFLPRGKLLIPNGMESIPSGKDVITGGMYSITAEMEPIPRGTEDFTQGMNHFTQKVYEKEDT